MSRVDDTVARILANVDGETKAESLGSEEHVEVLKAVADELMARHERLYPNVEAMRRDREDLARAADEGMLSARDDREVAPDFEASADEPAAGPAPLPASHPEGAPVDMSTGVPLDSGNGIASGPHGDPDVPVIAQPENTPATRTDRAPISAAGAPSTNDV
jgi:hypothetical protein